MDRSRLKMKVPTPEPKRSSDKAVPTITVDNKEQKPDEPVLYGWEPDTRPPIKLPKPVHIRDLSRNRPRFIIPKPKYDYTNPPEDPAVTAALFAKVQAYLPDFMKEPYTKNELRMFLPLNGDMSHGPDCDNFISLHDQRTAIMYQRSVKDLERKERIKEIELEKKRIPRYDPMLKEYERLRPRLDKFMAERRRLGLSDKIFEELPTIIPLTKTKGWRDPIPGLVETKRIMMDEKEILLARRLNIEYQKRLAAMAAAAKNGENSETKPTDDSINKNETSTDDSPSSLKKLLDDDTDSASQPISKANSSDSCTSSKEGSRPSDDPLSTQSNNTKNIPSHMDYQPISIIVPSRENETNMHEIVIRKKKPVCQVVPNMKTESHTVPDNDLTFNYSDSVCNRNDVSSTVPDSDESSGSSIAPSEDCFREPIMNRSRRRNALVDLPITSPPDRLSDARSDAIMERERYNAIREKKRRNTALLDYPRDIPLYPIDTDREQRDSLMEVYNFKEIPLSVIDPHNEAYRKPPVERQPEEYTDFDLLKSDPVQYQEQLKELEYYQNLKKNRTTTSMDMEVDVVGGTSSHDFEFNNPTTSSSFSSFGKYKKEITDLPVVIPLELVGEKIKPATLKSELMTLVDDNKSTDSTSTDCSSDSLGSLPTPEDSLINLQKKIIEQAQLRSTLDTQQALQAQQASYLENFNTNLKSLGMIGVETVKGEVPVDEQPLAKEKKKKRRVKKNKIAKVLDEKEIRRRKDLLEFFQRPVIYPVYRDIKSIPWHDIEGYLEASPHSLRNMKRRGVKLHESFVEDPPIVKKPVKMSRALKRELFSGIYEFMDRQKALGLPVHRYPGLTDDEDEEDEAPSATTEQTYKNADSSVFPSKTTLPDNGTLFHVAAEPTRFDEVGQLSIQKQLTASREATEEHFRIKKEAQAHKSFSDKGSSVLRSKSLNNNTYPSASSNKKRANGVKLPTNDREPRSSEDSASRRIANEFKRRNSAFAASVGIKRDQSTSRRGSEGDDRNTKTEEPLPKRRPPPVIQSTLDDEDAYSSMTKETINAIELKKDKNTYNVPDEDSEDDIEMEDGLPEKKLPPIVLKLKSSLNSRKRLESSTRNLSDENSSHARKIREETNRLTREELYLTSSLEGSNNSKYCRAAISKQPLEKDRQPMEEMRLEKRQKLSHDEPDNIKVNADIVERAAVVNGENRQTLSGLAKPETYTDPTQQQPASTNSFDMSKTLKALRYFRKFLKTESVNDLGGYENKRDTHRIYVEESDKFRIKKEARYELGKRNLGQTKHNWSHEELMENLQRYFTYLSFLIQGVLTGLLLGDTLYTFSFENEKVFPKDQALALPLNSVMCAGCTVACIAVMDILTNMKATVENQAKREKLIVALALWIVALTTSALSIASDEILSPVNENALDEESLLFRKLYCLTRSLSALGAWVFITYGMEMKRPKNEIGVNADVNQHVADELD